MEFIPLESGVYTFDKTALGETINTLEGTLLAKAGKDFIIRGVKGELYPIKKEIFHETYEAAE